VLYYELEVDKLPVVGGYADDLSCPEQAYQLEEAQKDNGYKDSQQ
jgi:hypothetical protein